MDPLLEFAVTLARDAGTIIRKNFLSGMTREWKDDNTPLTATDIAINRMVIERINAAYPDHDIVGEEESDLSRASAYTWVCDPVDGTVPFSHGVPTCVFAIALCENGVPILGVIYDPFMDRMYCAKRGEGATLNGKPITVNKNAAFAKSVAVVEVFGSATYDVSLIGALLDAGAVTMTPAGIIYMGGLLAAGELVAVCYPGTKPWDSAPVKIIVEEAGGKVTSVDGREQRYDCPVDGYIASNGVLHDELLDMVRKNMKR